MRVLLAVAFTALFLAGCTGTDGGNETGDEDGGDATPAPAPRLMPAVTHFEFPESAGCAGDAHTLEPSVPLNCVSFQGGPDATGIDGHWLALDETYAGPSSRPR